MIVYVLVLFDVVWLFNVCWLERGFVCLTCGFDDWLLD